MRRAATLVAPLLLLAAAPAPPNARIAAVEARLFLAETGGLSANILDSKGHFSGWNTVIGEGDAPGAADDMLIIVRMAEARTSEGGSFIEMPLEISATVKGKVPARRRHDGFLIPPRGTVALALWLPQSACAGRIDVRARFGAQVRSARLDMDCGE